jgi:hypothetical protein
MSAIVKAAAAQISPVLYSRQDTVEEVVSRRLLLGAGLGPSRSAGLDPRTTNSGRISRNRSDRVPAASPVRTCF